MSVVEYFMNDAVVTLPGGFTDKSVHITEWPLDGGDKIALVMQREAVSAETTLEGAVAQETKSYPARFTAFTLDRDIPLEVRPDGTELRGKAFRFKKDQDVFYNRQTFVLKGQLLLVMTVSSKAVHKTLVEQIADTALRGLRVR